jgi:hypothetical protein
MQIHFVKKKNVPITSKIIVLKLQKVWIHSKDKMYQNINKLINWIIRQIRDLILIISIETEYGLHAIYIVLLPLLSPVKQGEMGESLFV